MMSAALREPLKPQQNQSILVGLEQLTDFAHLTVLQELIKTLPVIIQAAPNILDLIAGLIPCCGQYCSNASLGLSKPVRTTYGAPFCLTRNPGICQILTVAYNAAD
jgi:hypothetical protein